MKISLRWVFDHIDADWKKVNIDRLVDTFNKKTAEIEHVQKVDFDFSDFSLCEVKKRSDDSVTVFSFEWSQEMTLSARDDTVVGNVYLIKKENKSYVWAKLDDFNCPKEGLVPAVYCDESFFAGGWKKTVESHDYILEIDNKSITHRPDMWAHRGFAREIAAILDLSFKPIDGFIKTVDVKEVDQEHKAKSRDEFFIKIENKEIGKRFAGLSFSQIKNRPSSLPMAFRLMKIGSRPIDAIVDFTNYVMLDLGQPMHAFDANKLSGKTIVPRLAKKGEKITLLDDDEVALTSRDYVIADGKKPIALAGVMGGQETGISPDTNAIFLESANFDASTIRLTSLRIAKRTEASARFEKSLDPNQNVVGIFRFLKLLEDEKIAYQCLAQIASLGKELQKQEIVVAHDFIEKCLGAEIDYDFIFKTLQKIEFSVESHKKNGKVEYKVAIPTFRFTKDVIIQEDVVEEIGRFFGYENIAFQLPKKITAAHDLTPVFQIRKIKRHLAYGLKMREVCNYPFYDESFLKKLRWEPVDFAQVVNPESENEKRLATSLIPHLIKNIDHNVARYDKLRFFEWGRIWKRKKDQVVEKKSLAGIFFDAKHIDFYCAKFWLTSLFELLGMDCKWEKVDVTLLENKSPWFFPYQAAKIVCAGNEVGFAGKMDQAFLSPLVEGDAFAFELDGDFLLNYKAPEKVCKPLSKYPESTRDISMFVPLTVTVDELITNIKSCDDKIVAVHLVDFFQKDEWKNKKSLTFRFILQDYTKTLQKEEVDSICEIVVKKLEKFGAALR